METRRIGSLDVSVVGLGCNNFGRRIDEPATARVLDAAIDAGITFFDTANMYGEGLSETYMGRSLRGRRDRIVIATKVGLKMDGEVGGGAPSYVREACERSMRRLNTDYIDLYQLHEPDPATPIADTLGAFQDLVREGKVREIGCSNFSAAQLREAEDAAGDGPRFVSVQNEYNLLHREPEIAPAEDESVLDAARRLDVAFLPFYPLASGLLTGKVRAGGRPPAESRLSEKRYERFITPDKVDVVEKLIAFAESSGHTILELAFAWLLSRPAVASVIAGARTPEQARMNADAGRWQLSAADLKAIDAMLPGGPENG
jgi:aryl-alcohol dehydrogenase-like predicted oxidoreductase